MPFWSLGVSQKPPFSMRAKNSFTVCGLPDVAGIFEFLFLRLLIRRPIPEGDGRLLAMLPGVRPGRLTCGCLGRP